MARELPNTLVEKLETLAGERRRNMAHAAVRIEDLAPLMQVKPVLGAAGAAGAAPTKAEFDALLAEVEALRTTLFAVQKALRRRQGFSDV